MTTVVEALNRIARQCGVKAPSSWLSATRDDQVELRDDFLMETVSDILDRVDLPYPVGQQQTVTGTGTTTYALNVNFRRLARDPLAVYDKTLDRPCTPVTSDGMWTHITDIGAGGAVRYYRVKGFNSDLGSSADFDIEFYPALPTGDEVVVSYVSKFWVYDPTGSKPSATGPATTWTSETDQLLLPRRLVETGAVWRFRERRGLPYQDKYNEYEILLSRLINDTRGRRTINMGEPVKDVRWQDLIPTFIPNS